MNSPDSNLERTLLETIPLFAKVYYGYIILEFIPFKIISSVDHLSGGEKISCLKLSGNKGTCLHCTVENKLPDFLPLCNVSRKICPGNDSV